MNATSEVSWLDSVRTAQVNHEATASLLRQVVGHAREAGHTWQEIGDTLGISRQAAHERFSK